MNLALFGGTFDPVHRGHLAVAKAAQARFGLRQVLFVPACVPPFKQHQPVTPFSDRYAMLAVATQGETGFLPSLLEAPDSGHENRPSYTIDTVRRFKRTLKKADRLFFLIGIDAFLEIASWREPEALLREVEFIVASRPGFSLGDLARALPEGIRPNAEVARALKKRPATGDIILAGAAIHLLEGVAEKVSATQVRAAAARGRGLAKLVGPAVAEYITKMHLYRTESRWQK
jgi:nicotinate-nucleotide adenylyltransferase